MGRIGITYLDVAKAATTIMQHGQQPTIDRIRERIGSGSKTTIATHLKQWKHDNEGEISLTRTSLPPTLLALVQGLWESMKQTTDEQIQTTQTQHQEEKQQLQKTIDELQQHLESKDNEIKSLQQVQKEWIEKYTDLALKAEKKAHENKTLEDKFNIQSAKMHEKEKQIKAQQRQIEQAFTNLEHFRASSQEQRQQEQLQADQQRQELQSQVKVLYAKLSDSQHEQAQLKAQHEVTLHQNEFLSEEKKHLEKKRTHQALEHKEALENHEILLSSQEKLKTKTDFYEQRIEKLDDDVSQKQQLIVELQWRLQQAEKEKELEVEL